MRKKTSDTVQVGNPMGFTMNQHVFPESAIKRFGSGPELRVHVHKLDFNSRKHYVPSAELFCALRVWDQATEHARSRTTERAYEMLADGIASGVVVHLTSKQNQIVTDFYGLWKARHFARTQPLGPVNALGASSEAPLSWEARENLEANGYWFTQGGTFPSQVTGSMQIMASRLHTQRSLAVRQWGIARALGGEFLVPDNCASLAAVPVTPTICLVGNAFDVNLNTDQVANINAALTAQAHAYYFARDLAACLLPVA